MRTLVLSILLLPVLLLGGEQRLAGRDTLPTPTLATVAADAPVACSPAAAATAAGAQSCSSCEGRCADQKRRCEDGSIKACYLAAACLCRCNLEAGGCGSSTSVLKECVEENERRAREIGD
jgi:hypothetical protein